MGKLIYHRLTQPNIMYDISFEPIYAWTSSSALDGSLRVLVYITFCPQKALIDRKHALYILMVGMMGDKSDGRLTIGFCTYFNSNS